MEPRKPLKLSIDSNEWDVMVDSLSRKGFTAEAISNVSGLSISQVRYRQHAFNVSVMAYRRGQSDEALAAISVIERSVSRMGLRKLSEMYR